MERYWVYIDNKVQGPVEIPGLRKFPGFNLLTQVCQEGQESWRMADEVIEIKAYFASPPRGSSLIPESQPDLPAEKVQMDMPLPLSAVATVTGVIETLPETPAAAGTPAASSVGAALGQLRVSCVTCGYKNPRDVAVCMKCGASLKAAVAPAEEKPPISLSALAEKAPVIRTFESKSTVSNREPSPTVSTPSPMVEIPVARIAIILVGVSLAAAIFFTLRHLWKARPKSHQLHPVVITNTPPANDASAPRSRSVNQKVNRSKAASLPGVSSVPSQKVNPSPSAETRAPEAPVAPAVKSEARSATPAPATYSVLEQAYPQQHRQPAPIDSKYAEKRRGDRGLWSSKEGAAIQLVQGKRIYGGQRTIRRNTEILMQILRDREYSSAFDSGKRLYLFDDVDWAAAQKDGPLWEVRLTFSGGRESDGSPRAPLRFAFHTDMERQSVEPGGEGMIKSNTMHAFFDESRIPPEERRSIAKDTEELVAAAQPGASPLALETVSRNYAATYSVQAITRVADTYGLTLVTKKLAHETSSVKEILPDSKPSAKSPAGSAPATSKLAPSASGAIQYTIEKVNGKERLVTALAPSRSTPAKLWETLTSYDRLTQFVPDVLVSQREGQDGAAIIVHTVSLTRSMFFVFKINLHLRILEHPQQHRLEFERIAGDFEKFSGYVEINPDPTGTRSSLELHLNLAPKGYVPNWAFRGMAERFVVPMLDAIRAKAESY